MPLVCREDSLGLVSAATDASDTPLTRLDCSGQWPPRLCFAFSLSTIVHGHSVRENQSISRCNFVRGKK